MSEATIRAAIYSAVSGVTDVGLVHDYERFANEWPAFLELFKTTISSTTQVRGWMVGYRGIPQSRKQTFVPGKLGTERTHRFQVLGIMGINDSEESEKTFAALAEDVCDALDDDTTLHAKGTFPRAAEVTMAYDPRPFAGVLVHAALISIDVTEII